LWATEHPDATIRALAAERLGWGAWYLSHVERLDDVEVVHAIDGLVRGKDDRDVVLALSESWAATILVISVEERIVKALDAAWNNDERVAKALNQAWLFMRVARAMSDAWDDDQRLVRALGFVADDSLVVSIMDESRDDVPLVTALIAVWRDKYRVVRALNAAWGDDRNRVRAAYWSAHFQQNPDHKGA
jgi:hypothetical protein